MNLKKLIGIVMLIGGIIMIVTSIYIKNEVSSGRREISSSQRQVNQANDLFSLTPQTKEVGKVFTDSAQGQINKGTLKADLYAKRALWLQIGGIILIILGIGVFFVGKKK